MADTKKAAEQTKLSWDCKLRFELLDSVVAKYHPADENEIKPKALTVGQEFELQCGGSPVPWEGEIKLEVVEEKDKQLKEYALKLKKVEYQDESQIRLKVFAYIPGKYTNLPILISDSKSNQVASSIEFEVESLLASQPKAYPKQEEEVVNLAENPNAMAGQAAPNPYPGLTGLKASYPMYLWYSVAALALGLCLLIAYLFLLARKKRAYDLRWKNSQVNTGNYKEFLKDLRKYERMWQSVEIGDQDFVVHLYNCTRLYLFREYKLDDRRISHKEIKKYFSPFLKHNANLSSYRAILILLEEMRKEMRNPDVKKEVVSTFVKEIRTHFDKTHLKSRSYR